MHTVTEQGIEVTTADESTLDKWDDYAERSPHGTAFHQLAALDVLADHTDTTVHTLVGFKGQEPVGIFPVFEKQLGPFSAAFSPPPDLWVFYLGPALLNVSKLKQRKAEKRHRRFVAGALRWIDQAIDPQYSLFKLHPNYEDPRPYEWEDFEVTPRYSYEIDVSLDTDELLKSFSRSARKNIEAGQESDLVVGEGHQGNIWDIIEQVSDRYEEQDKSFTVEPEFVSDLHDALPDGQIRPYVVTEDGEYRSGMITVEFGDRIDRWQGGVKPYDMDVPVNDMLDWHIMQEAQERERTVYDLNGANVENLCEYKAKFGPDVVIHHSLQRATTSADLLSQLYLKLR
ncbi:GNAT family N-acetyltransferase [Haloarculaceae archaeon H-GB2-1]|nr:GNAT family N-acetyltransferase [Haloarculaceae archaeon H-GB1-1]MEA5409991.1 GNAT family N-acetyltransferase [Haloarculaceae archaeon H-GB2-1]